MFAGRLEIVADVVGSDLKPEYREKEGAVRVTSSTALDFSIHKIEKMIGWTPQVSIEEGIARLIKWRQAQD